MLVISFSAMVVRISDQHNLISNQKIKTNLVNFLQHTSKTQEEAKIFFEALIRRGGIELSLQELNSQIRYRITILRAHLMNSGRALQ